MFTCFCPVSHRHGYVAACRHAGPCAQPFTVCIVTPFTSPRWPLCWHPSIPALWHRAKVPLQAAYRVTSLHHWGEGGANICVYSAMPHITLPLWLALGSWISASWPCCACAHLWFYARVCLSQRQKYTREKSKTAPKKYKFASEKMPP